MPLKLSVGLSKKVGQPDYGSIGATCGVEVELDPGLLRDDLYGFHERVKDAFVACQQAVNDELSRLQSPPGPRPTAASSGSVHHGDSLPESHRHRTPSSSAPARPKSPATLNQVRAIRAIARRAGTDLDALLGDDFGVDRPESLSRAEASVLIDRLKATVDA